MKSLRPFLLIFLLMLGNHIFLPETSPRMLVGSPESEIRLSDGAYLQGNYPPYTIEAKVLGSLTEAPVTNERIITAYSSTIDQTDDTPFITANGTRVRKGIVATNGLPFGTKIEIEGLGIFEVHDRMNSRYQNGEIDIWMETEEEALKFGRQNRLVWIYK